MLVKGIIKDIIKDRRYEFRDIEMLFKELEKGRGIIDKHILAVCKGIV